MSYAQQTRRWTPFDPTGPDITVLPSPSNLVFNSADNPSWSDTLKGVVAKTTGFAEINDRQNESVPWTVVPRAKKPPRLMFMRWQDRSSGASATLTNTFNNTNQFSWNLQESISGYDSLTLYSANLNMVWFTGFGQYLGIQLNGGSEMLGSGLVTSADGLSAGKMVQPTWLVNNAGGSATTADVNNSSNMGSPDPRNSVWACSIRGKSFGSLGVTLCDETLQPLVYVGSTPMTAYYFNLALLLQ